MKQEKEFNLEIEKAMEEVSVKNITAIAEYTRQTRELVNSSLKEVGELKKLIIQQNNTIEALRKQYIDLLVKTYQN